VFFARNYRGGPDPHLGIKSVVFVVAAAIALGGMVFEVGWLITVAIVLLALALIGGRIARARHGSRDGSDDETSPPDEER